jgi:sRNA-binding carbon storage regulator CsrA
VKTVYTEAAELDEAARLRSGPGRDELIELMSADEWRLWTEHRYPLPRLSPPALRLLRHGPPKLPFPKGTPMLVLTRKPEQGIEIVNGEERIRLRIFDIGSSVRIGIHADRKWQIIRSELLEEEATIPPKADSDALQPHRGDSTPEPTQTSSEGQEVAKSALMPDNG